MENLEIKQRLKRVFLINEEDLKSWQKATAKVSKEKVKKSDKLKYTLTVYFGSASVYQEFYINEQQYNLIIEDYKLDNSYAIHNIKLNIRLSKGIGKQTGEEFAMIDIVAVPKAVYIADKYLNAETAYKVMKLDNIRWETLNRDVDEDKITFDFELSN